MDKFSNSPLRCYLNKLVHWTHFSSSLARSLNATIRFIRHGDIQHGFKIHHHPRCEYKSFESLELPLSDGKGGRVNVLIPL